MVPLTNSLKHAAACRSMPQHAAASQNFLGDRWCLAPSHSKICTLLHGLFGSGFAGLHSAHQNTKDKPTSPEDHCYLDLRAAARTELGYAAACSILAVKTGITPTIQRFCSNRGLFGPTILGFQTACVPACCQIAFWLTEI